MRQRSLRAWVGCGGRYGEGVAFVAFDAAPVAHESERSGVLWLRTVRHLVPKQRDRAAIAHQAGAVNMLRFPLGFMDIRGIWRKGRTKKKTHQ